MVSTTRFFTLLCFAFSTFLAVSESKLLEPHAAESFNVSLIQVRSLFVNFPPWEQKSFDETYDFLCNFARGLQKLGASCSYTVIISTSCSSSRYTRDQISIAFGDAYGNQVRDFWFWFWFWFGEGFWLFEDLGLWIRPSVLVLNVS